MDNKIQQTHFIRSIKQKKAIKSNEQSLMNDEKKAEVMRHQDIRWC